MDLNTVRAVVPAATAGPWQPGDAWLAGGTYLFSQPHRHLRRLRDLAGAGWPALTRTPRGLDIAATCTIAELARCAASPRTAQRELIRGCCEAFLASFKIWNTATVGGNVCTALPAGPMISLGAALDGTCLVIAAGGGRRELPVAEFVTGVGTTALVPGEFLRSMTLPAATLRCRTAFRKGSLSPLGRSAALLVGRTDPADGSFVLTVTASTVRPVQLRFDAVPSAGTLRESVTDGIPDDLYVDDVHGLPVWRRQLTLLFAEQIRTELAGGSTR
ncbi:FAD binding domain-containing protein [Micromonospora sp. WMMD961]|uniref:FAD binding domain-containing protein n=1 Tax=Micromonospora sp. WMMD961 TaxID=3016100 RepID=UPI002416D6A7|nr:FAD binding domain-containing protein [Micromonospora sp. WMMD961]MDG4782170.1 FAD binding domain-containing protein [Micromonospora sp. WMMD961]